MANKQPRDAITIFEQMELCGEMLLDAPFEMCATGTVSLGLLAYNRGGKEGEAARLVNLVRFPSDGMVIELLDQAHADQKTTEGGLEAFLADLPDPDIHKKQLQQGRFTIARDGHIFGGELRPYPAWLVEHKHVVTAENVHPIHDVSAQPLLLSLLTNVLEAFRLQRDYPLRGERVLFGTLSALYIFSLAGTFHPHDPEEGGTADPQLWDPAAWKAHIDRPLAEHGSRPDQRDYKLVKMMLASEKIDRRKMQRWAVWLVGRRGYKDASGVSALEVATRLEHFMRQVVLTIVPESIGMPLELGKAMPAGMAVFHPDSARRRAFADLW
ncbi:hypothetical protein JCM10450v2_002935 [Rhodotorula kratochvilovae]